MAIRSSMNVSVTPENEKFVQELVASGRYHSASEVFRDGLRLIEQAEHRRLLEKWLLGGLTAEEQAKLPSDLLERAKAHVRQKIQVGLDAIARGEVEDGDEFFARWRLRLEQAMATGEGKPRGKRRA